MGVLKNVKKAAAGKMAKMAQGMAGDKESAAPKNEKLDQLNEIYQEQEEQLGSPVKDDDTILALDIGTEYVKAVIARQDKKGGLDVIGIGRAHQAASNMYAGAIADIPAVVGVCERALSQAEKMSGTTSKLTVVGIAGELIKGNTSTVRYRRKNGNKPLSEQEMSLIIKRVQDRAGEIARKEIADETNNPNVEVRLINSAIVSIAIDGYKISNPIGFKGTDVVIQFYTAFAPLVHISAIEKVCAELSLDLLAVAVEPFAVCRACLGDDIDSGFSGIVMDIGGGTTDIAVVDDGGVEGTKMFGIGGRGGPTSYGGGGGGFGGFEDIFSSFFGGGGAQVNPNAPRQGDDLQYRINLKFEEAIFGVEKQVKYNREELCHTCGGSGAKAGTHPETCHKCGGRGQINVVRDTPLGRMQTQVTCDVCNGTGKEIKEKCETCHGSGHEKVAHTVKVTVPAGVETGQKMRLQGQGDAGVNGGPYGDLYVVFQVEASDKFERDGAEIYYKMPMDFVQAALGDEIEVPTVHGNVKLKIPAGTQSETNFRLRGKGVPHLNGNGNGDEHVTVHVKTPKSLNKRQREAMLAFAAASGEDVKGVKKTVLDKLRDAFEDK